MKLVDILARELNVWPSGCEIIDQDSDRACYADYSDMLVLSATSRADDFSDGKVTRAEWQTAVDALKATKEKVMDIDWSKAPEGFPIWIESRYAADPSDWHRQEGDHFIDRKGGRWDQWQIDNGEAVVHLPPLIWNGSGLPPAGTVCELRAHKLNEWGRALIKFASRNVVVWDWEGEPEISGLWTSYAHEVEIRPIRTPEQIAVEEMKSYTAEICELLGWSPDYPGSVRDAKRLYDAGYRKFEIVEG
jgi:hypothetical protein